MAIKKRGTKGDYACHVPKGGHRKGCGGGNEVRELKEEVRHLAEKVARHEAHLSERAKQEAAFAKRVRSVTASGKAHHAKRTKKKG